MNILSNKKMLAAMATCMSRTHSLMNIYYVPIEGVACRSIIFTKVEPIFIFIRIVFLGIIYMFVFRPKWKQKIFISLKVVNFCGSYFFFSTCTPSADKHCFLHYFSIFVSSFLCKNRK